MKRNLICFMLTWLWIAAGLYAQEPVNQEMIAKFKAEGLENSQVLDTFNVLTNVIGPRLPATPAYKQAAQFVRDRLKSWQMENVHFESFEFQRGWTLEKLTIEMVEPRYFPLIGFPEAWTPSTGGEIVAEPLFLGGKTAEQVEQIKDKIAGSIILDRPIQTTFTRTDRIQPTDPPAQSTQDAGAQRGRSGGTRRGQNPTGPRPMNSRELSTLLQNEKAGVILRPNRYVHGTVGVLGRDRGDDTISTIVLSAEHYNMISRMIEHGLKVKLRVNVKVKYHPDDPYCYNIISEIPGVDPALKDEVVMLGAHLDSWHSSNGATDNADAVASSMEAMRILKAVGVKPKRTIRLGIWDGEEQGLLGSNWHARTHLAGDANKAARDKFSVYLNTDPGSGPIYGFYMENNEPAKQIFDAWLEPLLDMEARRNLIQGIGSTDHLGFIRAGVPGFTAIQDYTDYDVRTRHTNMDMFEHVSENDLKQCAVLLATFAYHAAMRTEKIPRNEN